MDVYVIYHVLCVDIYVISLFVLMESKKTKNSIFLGTRQSWEPNFPALPSARAMTLGKDFFKKILCRVPGPRHSAKFLKNKEISLLSARL
jgi:hypothetical protein